MSTATVQIRFGQVDIAGSGKTRQLEVPEGQFYVGMRIPIRIWGDYDGLSLQAGGQNLGTGSLGTASIGERNVREVVELTGQPSATTNFPIVSILSATAIFGLFDIKNNQLVTLAAPGGNITPMLTKRNSDGFSVNGASEVYGSVKISYQRSPTYRVWHYTFPAPGGTYWFFVMKGSEIVHKFSLSCDSTDPDLTSDGGGPADVSFVIKDNVTGQVVPGARLYIDGGLRGTSDNNGIINVKSLTRGAHTIRASCTGYVNTENDNLANDTLYF